jgi:ribose transport system ATP-binding protein
VLSVRALSMSFGGTRALDGVNLDVVPGEIHGLVGQNGSGKSTLIKVLSGYHTPEPGSRVQIAGQEVTLPVQPQQLEVYGIGFVHQDLGLSPGISVLENLLVDDLATKRRPFINWRRERERAEQMLRPFGKLLDVRFRVADLPPPDQAHVAIVRAVDRLRRRHARGDTSPGLLVLDEVTAFLSSEGREQLWQLVRDIVRGGDSVLFVSHYLDEVLGFTDRVTVFRDGRLVATTPTAELDSQRLIELILGRALAGSHAVAHRSEAVPSTDAAVVVSGLTGSLVRDLNFAARRGEVLGLTGLLGSGFEDVNPALFGASPARSGRLLIEQRAHDLASMSPSRATALGIAYVPEDRWADGGVGSLTVAENLTLQILSRYERKSRTLRRSRLVRDARALLDDFDVRPRHPQAKLADLSGGNAQKVILAKWLVSGPRLLLLDEPTHGVDVGSRAQILQRVRSEAAKGMTVLCASSDPEQLTDVCDRVLVLAQGRIVAELTGEAVNKEAIVEHCYDKVPA